MAFDFGLSVAKSSLRVARLKGAEQKIQRALEKHRVELETRYKGEAAASITLNLFFDAFILYKRLAVDLQAHH